MISIETIESDHLVYNQCEPTREYGAINHFFNVCFNRHRPNASDVDHRLGLVKSAPHSRQEPFRSTCIHHPGRFAVALPEYTILESDKQNCQSPLVPQTLAPVVWKIKDTI